MAAKDLGKEVRRQVADHEEHCCPGEISESLVNGKQAEVENEDRQLVAQDAYQVYHIGVVDPLLPVSLLISTEKLLQGASLTFT